MILHFNTFHQKNKKNNIMKQSQLKNIVRESIKKLNEKEKGCFVNCEYAPSGGTEKIWCKNCSGNWFVSAEKMMENCCKSRKVPGSGSN